MSVCLFFYYIKKMIAPSYASTPSFNGYNSSDLHAWVELGNGRIMDYPIETLKSLSAYGTKRVKYVPFKKQHQAILYDRYVYKLTVQYNEFVCMGFDKEYADRIFYNTGGYCMYRALVLQKRLQEKGIKSKVVFGSLGFIQDDDSIFYEFG